MPPKKRKSNRRTAHGKGRPDPDLGPQHDSSSSAIRRLATIHRLRLSASGHACRGSRGSKLRHQPDRFRYPHTNRSLTPRSPIQRLFWSGTRGSNS
jgi:hypothetical protein